MASSSQHRCVFVGNIPYDATEEQLIDICREVGPVVSFRLVIDRETGKPKGYGFCEYKDEETALSARRNLQGYEINGRQLRVDFAENDKNADRNREQGRGGPGLAANVDFQKQVGGPAVPGESARHQPIGLHIAMTAATVMAGALGGPQTGLQSNQGSLQSQSASAGDPLTFHLAKMSRSQLSEIVSDLKVMATQNRELARQLLLARPQLPKALFQAQIMLGMVTPQVLQMPNIRQPALPSLQETHQGQQPAIQTLPGLPPPAHRMPSGFVPQMQEGQLSAVPQSSLVHNQLSAPLQPSIQPRTQIPQHANNHVPQQASLLGKSGIPQLPPAHLSVRPQAQVANSSSSGQQMKPSFLQPPGRVGTANLRHNSPMVLPSTAMQSSLPPRPPMTDVAFQPGPRPSSGLPDAVSKAADRSARAPDDVTWASRSNAYLNMQTSSANDSQEPIVRPSKLLKLDDGNSRSVLMGGSKVSNATGSEQYQAFAIGSVPPNPVPKLEESQYSEKQVSQLPPEIESALLQQVLSLTPEQLSSLPPEQQQEVIQLQQVLRRDQIQPS